MASAASTRPRSPGSRDQRAQAGDGPGLVPYKPQVTAAAAILAPVNWAMT